MTGPVISPADRAFMAAGENFARIVDPRSHAALTWTREAIRRGLHFDPKPTERLRVVVTYSRAVEVPCAA